MPIDRNSAQYITGAIYKPTQTSAPGVWDLDDQANNIAKNLWPLPPSAIQRSLRFNSADSAYLNRTPATASNRKTWTWSGWVKRATLGNGSVDGDVFAGYWGASYYAFHIQFGVSDNIAIYDWGSGGGGVFSVNTPAVFRDPSAWYHIVIAFDTTQVVNTNRVKIYVNNVEQTSLQNTNSWNTGQAGYPSQNYDTPINGVYAQFVGGVLAPAASKIFSGYMAEVNFVDGQQLTPTSFGETDQQTGVWIPKRYLGTYGTNGFRLSFANNSSITALGYDSSGQGNNWTPSNFSITPGVGNDVFVDVPSLYGTDTGLGGEVLGNYATLNPILPAFSGIITLSNGALDATTAAGTTTGQSTYATFAVSSGKWYWEATFSQSGSSSFEAHIGWATAATDNANAAYGYLRGGQKVTLGTAATYGSAYVTGDVIGVALDLDAGTMTFYKNGVSQGTAFTGLTGTLIPTVRLIREVSYTTAWYTNFGQRPFAYPAPSGYKALCTTNLSAPAIGQTSNNRAGNYFNVVTYTGDGAASKSITGVGFQPDLVWIKSRTNASGYHILVDSVRGAGLWMATNTTTGDSTAGQLVSSLDTNGFSLNLNPNNTVNELNANYVAWCWNAGGTSTTNSAGTNNATIASTYRANKAAGFSIVTWAGSNAVGTVAHGLGVAPSFIIAKSRTTANSWGIFHQSANSGSGQNGYLLLNGTGTFTPDINAWNNTAPTANVFSVAAGGFNTGNMVAYCFAAVPGFSAFGSYTGNASTDGTFVYTGFKPAFILIKDLNNANSWIIMDNKRTGAYNPQDGWLVAQATDTEYNVSTSDSRIDFLSNGFKLRNSNAGNNGSRIYIYAAFAETPARLSTAR